MPWAKGVTVLVAGDLLLPGSHKPGRNKLGINLAPQVLCCWSPTSVHGQRSRVPHLFELRVRARTLAEQEESDCCGAIQ